jgi:hypothetical protein
MRTDLHLDSIFSDPYVIWDPSNMLLEIIPIWIFNPTSKHTEDLFNANGFRATPATMAILATQNTHFSILAITFSIQTPTDYLFHYLLFEKYYFLMVY